MFVVCVVVLLCALCFDIVIMFCVGVVVFVFVFVCVVFCCC